MPVKLLCGIVICACSFFLGGEYSREALSQIKIIGQYEGLLCGIASHIAYSRGNLREYFYTNRENFSLCEAVFENKNIPLEKALKNYRAKNKNEEMCVNMLIDAIKISLKSSDAEYIAAVFGEAAEKLKHKRELIEKEKMPVIKTAPKLFLTLGVFISVMIL